MGLGSIQAALIFSENARKKAIAAANAYSDTALAAAIAALPKAFVYKGAVNYVADLPAQGNKIGDCYTVLYKGTAGTEADGTEYAWANKENVEQWVPTGPDITGKADKALIAQEYAPTSAYDVGAYCLHDDNLYRCTAAIPALGEAWTPAHWVQTTVVEELIRANAEMVGASSSADGQGGRVPAPTSEDREKFLRGDGSWATPQTGGEGGDLGSIVDIPYGEWVDNSYIYAEFGRANAYEGYCRTDYVLISGLSKIRVFSASNLANNVGLSFYASKSESDFIRDGWVDMGPYDDVEIDVDVPPSANYVRISCWGTKKDQFTLKGISLAEALANHVSDFRSELGDFVKVDLGDYRDGYISSTNGNFHANAAYKATDLIYIRAKKIRTVVTAVVATVGIAFYDEGKRYVGGSDFVGKAIGDEVDINVPNGARYVALCANVNYVGRMSLKIVELANAICVQNGANPCYYTDTHECRTFKKILCIGDSLTAGNMEYDEGGTNTEFVIPEYSYPSQLAALTGHDTVNKGFAGLTTKTWWERHSEDDLSGCDACIIALGVNDQTTGRETTTAERHEYMGYIINKVRDENPQIPIFVSTMMNMYTRSLALTVNQDLRDIAEENECFLIDLSAYCNILSEQRYNHLTATGYLQLATYYYNYISYIMHHNLSAFRDVQFVGTGHSHT